MDRDFGRIPDDVQAGLVLVQEGTRRLIREKLARGLPVHDFVAGTIVKIVVRRGRVFRIAVRRGTK